MLPVFLQVTRTLSILVRGAVSAEQGKCCGSISVLSFPLPEREKEMIFSQTQLILMPLTAHMRLSGPWAHE